MVYVGVDVNLQNNDGWTAVMMAARDGHLDCIEELMRHGANIPHPSAAPPKPFMPPPSPAAILTLLYEATSGEQWGSSTNWIGEADVCTWSGVNCIWLRWCTDSTGTDHSEVAAPQRGSVAVLN